MGLDVGTIKINYLTRQGGVVYDFTKKVCDRFSDCGGSFCTFTFLQEDDLLEEMVYFFEENNFSEEEKEEVRKWVDNLPWEDGEVTLCFSW